MSRKLKTPSYRKHKASGQAIVTLPDGYGGRRDHLLGTYGTKASKESYAALIADWKANGRRLSSILAGAEPGSNISVNEVLLAFWHYAEGHYSEEGQELHNFRSALRPVKRMFGELPVSQFGPKCLKKLQLVMADGSWMTEAEQIRYRKKGWKIGMACKTLNRQIVRVRTVFKWAESEEMVPKGTYNGLQTVRGFAPNATEVRHAAPVEPATWEQVEKIAAACELTPATMLQLQWWAGMRSMEVRLMRLCDIDRSNPACWRYCPSQHKNAWRGQDRVIPLGAKCIELLRPFVLKMQGEPDAYLFAPKLRRKHGDPYSRAYYCQVIRDAAERVGILRFHPYMARHGAKMRIEAEAGTEAARAVLGHKSIQTTTHYGKLDADRACGIMAKLG